MQSLLYSHMKNRSYSRTGFLGFILYILLNIISQHLVFSFRCHSPSNSCSLISNFSIAVPNKLQPLSISFDIFFFYNSSYKTVQNWNCYNDCYKFSRYWNESNITSYKCKWYNDCNDTKNN